MLDTNQKACYIYISFLLVLKNTQLYQFGDKLVLLGGQISLRSIMTFYFIPLHQKEESKVECIGAKNRQKRAASKFYGKHCLKIAH